MRTLKLTMLALAAYGGYTLWNRYGVRLREHADGLFRSENPPADRRIEERSELTAEEWTAGSDDPVAQATAILADSDQRTKLSREAPGIERRRSEDTVEP